MPPQGWNLEHSYTTLPQMFYVNQKPEAPPNSTMFIFNHNLAKTLGLNANSLHDKPYLFSGLELPTGSTPIAQAYAGYQFGVFAMLGDGRAVLLGEQITPDGLRFDVQLKGSGRTAFSRGGDGYAALKPMLREYIISEGMYYLGIPTTRSLAVTLTGNNVRREQLLQGAVLTRTASSHIRVGTFNYASAFGTTNDVRALADYTIWRHFSEINEDNGENKYVLLFREIAKQQAKLISDWMLCGFIHGVMNTDNTSICGETIDYGPCAFMDIFDPQTVFSSIDTEGRYAYNNQPKIGAWNLARLAEDLLPLFDTNQKSAIEMAEKEIEHYWAMYNRHWLNKARLKLGLTNEEEMDNALFNELLDLMASQKLDFTNTFRSLSNLEAPVGEWGKKWQTRLTRQPITKQQAMDIIKKNNTAIIPRNHLVEDALEAADNGDISVMNHLLAALSKPYEDSEEAKKYSQSAKTCGCEYKTFCGT